MDNLASSTNFYQWKVLNQINMVYNVKRNGPVLLPSTNIQHHSTNSIGRPTSSTPLSQMALQVIIFNQANSIHQCLFTNHRCICIIAVLKVYATRGFILQVKSQMQPQNCTNLQWLQHNHDETTTTI